MRLLRRRRRHSSVTVIAMRHADSEDGGEDPPLSDIGTIQASSRTQILEAMLRGREARIMTSPAIRARETAIIVAEGIRPGQTVAYHEFRWLQEGPIETLLEYTDDRNNGYVLVLVTHRDIIEQLYQLNKLPVPPEITHAALHEFEF